MLILSSAFVFAIAKMRFSPMIYSFLRIILLKNSMSCQKAIIDKIRDKGGDFVIELKENQRSLRYGLEDSSFQRTYLHIGINAQ